VIRAGTFRLSALVAAQGGSHPVARTFSVGVLLIVVFAVYWFMARGWRHRAARQIDIAELPEMPDHVEGAAAPVSGVYVSTTGEGGWLDRIVTHGLGVRSEASMTVAPDGVHIERIGAPGLFIPSYAVRGVRLERGMPGKIGLRPEELLVITWQHGEHVLQSGFRPRHSADREVLLKQVDAIRPIGGDAA